MSRSIRSFVPLFLAAGLLFGSAQAADLKTADEVIAKLQEARGGAEAWAAVKTVRLGGTMKMGPMEMPFTLEMARPAQTRMEMSLQGMTLVQAYDGKQGWAIMPMLGKTDPEPLGADDLKQAKDQADIDGALIDYASKGHKVELLGKVDVDGTPAYKLKINKASGTEEIQYVDAEHFLVIKSEATVEVQGQKVQNTTTVGDYKEVDGKMFPHSMINDMNGPQGAMKQEMTLTKVEFNAAIPAERFTMPAKAAPAAAK